MSTKRTHDESEDIHPSRQGQVDIKRPNPSKKPRRTEPATVRKQAHASSVNAIKKRLRDVNRRLQRSQDLPATVRADDERALTAYQQELAAADEEKHRQRMIKKYHMVRFFERKRATRMLKKLKKQLLETQSTEQSAKITTRMDIIEIDLNYTQYFPLNERYISLYPPKGSDEEAVEAGEEKTSFEDVIAQKPEMWKIVEKAMADGTLHQLRYGVRKPLLSKPKANTNTSTRSERPAAPQKAPVYERAEPSQQNAPVYKANGERANRRERRQAMGLSKVNGAKSRKQRTVVAPVEELNDGNISDGGFFEE